MQVKIAICDDSSADRQYVCDLVSHWASLHDHTARLSLFPSAEQLLFQHPGAADYDILLLDIELGAMDGVTLAKKIRQTNDSVQIVFLTGYSDYIAEGYEVAALHYLLKPVNERKLFSVLDRAVEKLWKNEKVLLFEIGGELERLPVYEIRYADVAGNYITIHAVRDLTVKMPLGELEKQLDERFYRAGRSLIVNLTRVSRVTRETIRLLDGTCLPLPRGAYEGVNRAIIQLR